MSPSPLEITHLQSGCRIQIPGLLHLFHKDKPPRPNTRLIQLSRKPLQDVVFGQSSIVVPISLSETVSAADIWSMAFQPAQMFLSISQHLVLTRRKSQELSVAQSVRNYCFDRTFGLQGEEVLQTTSFFPPLSVVMKQC